MVGVSMFWLLTLRLGVTPPLIGMIALFGLSGLVTKGGGVLAYGVSWSYLGLGMTEGGQGTQMALSALAVVGGYIVREISVEWDKRFNLSRRVFDVLLILGILAVVALLGGLLTGSHSGRATEFWGLMVSHMLLALVIAHYVRDAEGLKLMLVGFILGAGVAAGLALTGTDVLHDARLTFGEGLGSLRRLSNALALGILALLSFMMFGQQFGAAARGRWLLAVQYSALATLVAVLLLTASRGALLGVLMAFGIALWMMFARGRVRLQTLGIALAGLSAAIVAFLSFDLNLAFARAFPVIAGRVGVESLKDHRIEFWAEAFTNTDWTVFFLGGGIRGWSTFAQLDRGFSAHSFFVDWLFVFGIPGVIIGFLFFSSIIRAVWRKQQDWAFLWLGFFVFGFATYGTVPRAVHWVVIGVILSVLFRALTVEQSGRSQGNRWHRSRLATPGSDGNPRISARR